MVDESRLAPSIAPNEGTKPVAKWHTYVSGFFGGFLLSIGDLLTNDTSATVLKLQSILQKHIMPSIDSGGFIGLLLIGGLGAIFCWIWPVTSRGDAFTRGFSVFAILAVGTPYKVMQGQMPPMKEAASAERTVKDIVSLIIPSANAQPSVPGRAESEQVRDLSRAATIAVDHTGISSCKPHYWGLFGLGSLVNNSLEICKTSHTLKAGTRITILDCWDTGFRNYRYVKMAYIWEGERKVGWAIAGQGPRYWQYIVPDPDSSRPIPRSCAN